MSTRIAENLIQRLENGTPPNVALMHLLGEAASPAEAEAAVSAATASAGSRLAEPLAETERLRLAHPDAWAAVHSILDTVDHTAAASPDASLDYWAGAFDRLARISPEAGVALYALGSPDLFAATTAEVVERLQAWGLLGSTAEVLDLGCGIGRFAELLAPLAGSVLGLDLSAEMIGEARRRCAAPNLRFERTGGRDLASVKSGSMDLVLAADVFPYLVQAGGSLAQAHLAETFRVLRPGGSLVILNFSYRGDIEQDRADIARSAQALGFAVPRAGTREFRLWDAATFHLLKPSSTRGRGFEGSRE